MDTYEDVTYPAEYSVVCESVGNPDHGQYASLSPRRVFVTASLEMCQQAARRYIQQHDLGGGNWLGGEVKRDGITIGHISYNGRFWPCEVQS